MNNSYWNAGRQAPQPTPLQKQATDSAAQIGALATIASNLDPESSEVPQIQDAMSNLYIQQQSALLLDTHSHLEPQSPEAREILNNVLALQTLRTDLPPDAIGALQTYLLLDATG